MAFFVQQEVKVTATVKNLAGILTTPSITSVKVKAPDLAVTEPGVSEDSEGIMHVTFLLEEAGTYVVRFEGKGSLVTAVEKEFTVEKSRFYP